MWKQMPLANQNVLPGFEPLMLMASLSNWPATNGSAMYADERYLFDGVSVFDTELLYGPLMLTMSRSRYRVRSKRQPLDFAYLKELGLITDRPCLERFDTLTTLRLLNCTPGDWVSLTSTSSLYRNALADLTISLITQGSDIRRLKTLWKVGKLPTTSANTPANRAMLCQKVLGE